MFLLSFCGILWVICVSNDRKQEIERKFCGHTVWMSGMTCTFLETSLPFSSPATQLNFLALLCVKMTNICTHNHDCELWRL